MWHCCFSIKFERNSMKRDILNRKFSVPCVEVSIFTIFDKICFFFRFTITGVTNRCINNRFITSIVKSCRSLTLTEFSRNLWIQIFFHILASFISYRWPIDKSFPPCNMIFVLYPWIGITNLININHTLTASKFKDNDSYMRQFHNGFVC